MARDVFEDCRVGDRAQSPGRTVTEADIVLFAAVSGDWMPIHTDAEYARGTPFGERIAHGLLVLTLGSTLLLGSSQPPLLPRAALSLSEIERVRFVAPAKIGDTIRAVGEIVTMAEIDSARGLVAIKVEIKNQRSDLLVSFTVKAVLERRRAVVAGVTVSERMA